MCPCAKQRGCGDRIKGRKSILSKYSQKNKSFLLAEMYFGGLNEYTPKRTKSSDLEDFKSKEKRRKNFYFELKRETC